MISKPIHKPSKHPEYKQPALSREAYIDFCLVLLGVTNFIRSGVLVDSSLLPRALILNLILIIAFISLYRHNLISRTGAWIGYLFGFYAWNLISSLWSISPAESIMQAQLIFLGIGVFIIISYIDRIKPDFIINFIRIQILALLFSFILAFTRIFELEFYDPYKIISISLNNNLYSGFLLLSLPLMFMGYSFNKGVWRYLTVLCIILSFFFIIIVQSRAVYMGLLLTLSLLVAGTVLRYRNVLNVRNILTGVASVVIIAGALGIFYQSLDNTRKNAFLSKVAIWNYLYKSERSPEAPPSPMVQDQKEATTPVIEIPVEYFENVNARLIFWKKSMGLIREHPVLGVGSGNWRINVAKIPEPQNPELTIRNYTYSQPHNEWIGILSETGIPGALMALMIFLFPVLLILARSAIAGIKEIPFHIFCIAAFLCGFYVFASFDFPFRRVEHLVLLFSLFGFIYNRVNLTGFNRNGLRRFQSVKYFHLFMIILLLFTLFVVSLRIKGEYFTLKIFMKERKNDRAVVGYCAKAKNLVYTITPNALSIDWFSGVANFRLGNTKAAEKAFESAMKSTPYEVRLLNDYSATLYKMGKVKNAVATLTYALKLDPHFDDAKYNLAAIYFERSMPDSALYYVKSCRDSQKKKDYLGEIYSSYFK